MDFGAIFVQYFKGIFWMILRDFLGGFCLIWGFWARFLCRFFCRDSGRFSWGFSGTFGRFFP